ncbi:MAG: ribosome assembly cofactor RimP, partial [Flavobacteriaceae bacterium CG_4_8_14_3_um_filter_31_8]
MLKMDQAKVKYLVEEALAENESLFLLSILVSASNKISIVVDGDHGVPLSECVRISRNV